MWLKFKPTRFKKKVSAVGKFEDNFAQHLFKEISQLEKKPWVTASNPRTPPSTINSFELVVSWFQILFLLFYFLLEGNYLIVLLRVSQFFSSLLCSLKILHTVRYGSLIWKKLLNFSSPDYFLDIFTTSMFFFQCNSFAYIQSSIRLQQGFDPTTFRLRVLCFNP